MDQRDKVTACVQQKYGESSVGQIATFAELKAKSVIKDVARSMGITPAAEAKCPRTSATSAIYGRGPHSKSSGYCLLAIALRKRAS